MKLKRYVRYNGIIYEFLKEQGKRKAYINIQNDHDIIYLKDEDVDDVKIKSKDTKLELAQVGDMVEYERLDRTIDRYYLKDKLTYENNVLIEHHGENSTSTYEFSEEYNRKMYLWVRQDNDTFKRYSI